MFSNLTVPTQPQSSSNARQGQNYFSGIAADTHNSDERNAIALHKVKRREDAHPVTASITFATANVPMNINVSKILHAPAAQAPKPQTLTSCVLEKFFSNSSSEKKTPDTTHTIKPVEQVKPELSFVADEQPLVYTSMMNIDLLWQLYAFYAVLMGLATLLIPHYVDTVALLLCPVFTFIVACHGSMARHVICLYIAVLVVFMYPIVFLYYKSSQAVPVAYYLLFLVFIGMTAWFEKFQRYLWIAMAVLLSGSVVGIIVYYVYPKSIHGIHATAMAMTVLTCTTLFFSQKRELIMACRFCKQS